MPHNSLQVAATLASASLVAAASALAPTAPSVSLVAAASAEGAAKSFLMVPPPSPPPSPSPSPPLPSPPPSPANSERSVPVAKRVLYKFLIVLELAGNSLTYTIDHEHIAGEDFIAIRLIAVSLGTALSHLHTKGRIHADFKPPSVSGDRYTWKIMGLDVFCRLGEPFGNKVPSSGFCPPEMAKILLTAINPDTGKVDNTSLLKEYIASEAYDMWSFGVVLYHLCFGRPLWLTDTNDDVNLEGLQLLASGPLCKALAVQGTCCARHSLCKAPLCKALNKALNDGMRSSASDTLKTATTLIRKLLEPDPLKRLEHFEQFDTPMEGVLEEPFFQGRTVDDITLGEINTRAKDIQADQKKQLKLLTTIDARTEEIKGLQRAAVQLLNKHASELRYCIQVRARWWCTHPGPRDPRMRSNFSRVPVRLRLMTSCQPPS